MTPYQKEIVVTEEEWTKTLNDYWNRYVNSYTREGLEVSAVMDRYFHSGNIENFYKEELEEGVQPSGEIAWIPICNPKRDLDLFFHNLTYVWNWVSENPSERTPRTLGGIKEDMSEKLVALVKRLGCIDTPFLDPVCSAKLFKMVFGDTYRHNNFFPIPLGTEKRQIEIIIEPDEMFVGLMASLGNYLFHVDCPLECRQSIELVDYWLSTIPLVMDKRVFDTVYHEVEGVKRWHFRQKVLRALLARLYGYNVYAEEVPVLPHNDIELEDYLKAKLAEPQMPPELHRLIAFVHEHKENCRNVESE